MRYALLALLLSLTACATKAQQTGKLTYERDRFTGSSWIEMGEMIVRNGWTAETIRGRAMKGGPAYLTLISQTSTWIYMRCHDVALLLDGVPMSPDEVAWDGQAFSSGGVKEVVAMKFDTAKMGRLVRAHRIEMRVCRNEFELSPTNVASVRRLMSAGLEN